MITWYKKRKKLKGWQPVKMGLVLLVVLFGVGCKSQKPMVQSSEGSHIEVIRTEVEKLVPYALPADSVTLQALLECDSTNKVLLRQISNKTSKGFTTDYSFEKGILSLAAHRERDTIYLPAKEKEESKTLLQQSETHTQQVEKTLPLAKFFWWSGLASWMLLVVFVTRKLTKHFK
jgi:hypothetical protein